MDKHWYRLITAQGGAPGYFIDTQKHNNRGGAQKITTYVGDDGVRFTAPDVQKHRPDLAYSTCKYRCAKARTFKEAIR
jgi:hypothetical protein